MDTVDEVGHIVIHFTGKDTVNKLKTVNQGTPHLTITVGATEYGDFVWPPILNLLTKRESRTILEKGCRHANDIKRAELLGHRREDRTHIVAQRQDQITGLIGLR